MDRLDQQRRLRNATRLGVFALFLVTLLALVAVSSRSTAAPQRASGRVLTERITLGAGVCAPGWRAATPGTYVFTIENRTARSATASLMQFGSGVLVAELASSPPGSAGKLTARLMPGSAYQWSCAVAGAAPVLSAGAQVSWSAERGTGPPAPTPVATIQLLEPLDLYRAYVERRLAVVRRQLAALGAQIAAADVAGARSTWLAAHLTWLEIGQDDGAYGAFGSLGARIDGAAEGLVDGPANPDFSGFHKIELDLWSDRDLGAAAVDTVHLRRLVASLTSSAVDAALPATTAGINSWTLRCHEILEDALRDSLTADDDYGSHTDLASITADVAATRELLRLLAPLIIPRSAELVSTAEHQLTAVDQAVAAAKGTGGWPRVESLSLRSRQTVDADTGAALETLAPVSELMQIGST